MTTIDELCEGMCEKLGIDGLRPNAKGAFAISVDDIKVEFLHDETSGRLLVDAEIGDLPDDAEVFRRRMLEANRLLQPTKGATLYLDSADGHAAACRSDPIASLDVDGYLKILEDFVNLIRAWRARREDFVLRGGEIDAPVDKITAEGSIVARGNYLRV